MSNPQASDPFHAAGGETRPDAERGASGFFWKPDVPTYLVGRLDRIEAGKQYGDYAVLSGAVTFRAEDHRPLHAGNEKGETAVSLQAASLAGKITAEDVGQYLRVQFVKWVNTANGRMRVYTVTMGLDAPATEAILARARKRVAEDQVTAPLDDTTDDLPF